MLYTDRNKRTELVKNETGKGKDRYKFWGAFAGQLRHHAVWAKQSAADVGWMGGRADTAGEGIRRETRENEIKELEEKAEGQRLEAGGLRQERDLVHGEDLGGQSFVAT